MGLRDLNAEVLRELRVATKNSNLRQRDIVWWDDDALPERVGESMFYLPKFGTNVVFKTPNA